MTEIKDKVPYITAAREASASLVIEKSRFIAHVSPCASKDAAEAFISSIRAEYKDATHNVPAYVIGRGQEVMWSSEDGEPSGTAGAPVLKMLVQEGLTDVCVVITRYFGGIKLGTGGLVRAYTQVAKMALAEAGRAEVKDLLSVRCRCDYKTYNKISTYGFDDKARVENPVYESEVTFEIIMEPEHENDVMRQANDISGGSLGVLEKIITQDKILC